MRHVLAATIAVVALTSITPAQSLPYSTLPGTQVQVAVDSELPQGIALGSYVTAALAFNGAPLGSVWQLHVSFSTGTSATQIGGQFVPLALDHSVLLDSGTTGPSNTLVSTIYVPNDPQLVGHAPVFQLVVVSPNHVMVSNLASGGPIIHDILH